MKNIKLLLVAGVVWLFATQLDAQLTARYIRINQNDTASDDYINLAEIRAIQNGTGANLALNKPVSASSSHSCCNTGQYVDGSIPSYGATNDAGTSAFVEVDLGAEYLLDEIQIVNRQDCCQSRADNLQLILKSGAGTVLYSLPIDAYQGQNSAYQTNWVLPGAALNFDGDDDYVQLPSVLPFGSSSLTFEAKVKVPTVGTGGLTSGERVGILLGNHDGGVNPDFNFEINASGRARIYWNEGEVDAAGTTDLRDNLWHHVAFVRDIDQNKLFVYVDGALEINHNSAGSNLTLTTTHRLGSDNRSGNQPNFHGGMDEARIWSVARTQGQIQNFSECELTGTEAGLHSYYHFNQSSGTSLPDTTANANNGTLTNFALSGASSNWLASGGVTTGNSCTVASALAFDGTNDYVTFGNPPAHQITSGTIEFWVKSNSTAGNDVLCAKNGFFEILLQSSGLNVYDAVTGNLAVTSGINLANNTWRHVAMTFAPGANNAKLYVDGALTNTFTLSNAVNTNGFTLSSANAAQACVGSFDEFRIWNTVRSGPEIQANKDCELQGTETGLEAYYQFNQGIVGANNAGATTLTDATSNANNGTLNNFSLTGTASNWVAPGAITSGTSCMIVNISGNTNGCDSTVLTAYPSETGSATYAWSNGATTAETTITSSGTYNVTVTVGGALATASVVVTINTPPSEPTFSVTATVCDTVTLTANGSLAFAWSNGANTAETSFTESGTYTVTTTDGNGCTASASQVVTVNKAVAAISGDAEGCDEVTLTAMGGDIYAWTGGATGASATFEEPGNYSVIVTDANGCTASAMHTIFIVGESKTYYLDADGDGYGNSTNPVQSCSPLAGYILVGLDCDDADPTINPGAAEVCDEIDNNCNGILIETACGGSDAPVSDACASRSTIEVLNGQVFFNYGSVTDAINTSQSSSFTIGQPVVDFSITTGLNMGFGFWSRFLLAPSAPIVSATEGDLPDRVQINWSADPLSPSANSYKIYRDGALLATVDDETFAFIDFNVLAGQFYTYAVAGTNQFGEGRRGSALGFLNPNGVVTGQIKTFSGNPVVGAVVELTPTLGTALSFDGISTVFSEYEPAFPRDEFTLSCWAKIGDGNPVDEPTGIFDFGSSLGKNWWLHAVTPADGSKGVTFGIGKNLTTRTEISHTLPDSTKNGWHHYTASYNGSALLFYVDGELVETAVGQIEADSTVLFLGKRSDEGGYFIGKLDEMRLYSRQLAQTEIQMTMAKTVSGAADGLAAYWKFDEGTGSKGFDISANRTKMHLCGARWTTDKPTVVNAGISDETGFYRIEGVNYAAGQTFTAIPYKNFYFNQSLEFNAANQSYASLTDFDLPDSSTVEVTVKNFDFSANQTILSKQNGSTTHFNLSMNAGNLLLEMGGTVHNFGALAMGFHRLTFVIEQSGGSAAVTFYKNGTLAGSHTFSGVAADFTGGTPWTLGAKRNGGNLENHFTGLIDEVVVFSSLLPLSDIQTFANIGTDVTHSDLSVNFNLNEGEGTELHDMGTSLTGEGTVHSARWSTVAAITQTLAHEFTPSSRLVTLNPSNTSADQIDFTDQSTVPISGYVRFENTNCFQKGVEILVDGQSFSPPVMTDVDGKFVLDLEPGKSLRLSPKFEEHSFYPAFWDLSNVSSPVAGILFRNQTKRKVIGQIAGNETCRKSVIPTGAIVKVKVSTLNGCFEKEMQLTGSGKFVFEGVPPDSVTVAVTEHSNPIIYTYFQNKGGAVLDLKMENDTVDFIYLAPPQVELSPMDTNQCGEAMLEIAAYTQTNIKVFEQYDGGVCYLDTAMLTINNEISDLDQFDTLMTEGQFKYRYRAGSPNIITPFLKTLQVTAEAHDELATATVSTVVLGKRARQTTYATTSPELPTLILRDPPGDGSSATMQKDETTCQTWSYSADYGGNLGVSAELSLGPKITTSVGLGAEVELTLETEIKRGFEINTKYNNLTTNSSETCTTITEAISTSSDPYVVGSNMGGDVYMGGAVNYIFGITDDLLFDTSNCSFYLDKDLYVFPDGFATTFVYSERHIKDLIIPQLNLIGDTLSAQRWQEIIDLNNQLKANAIFSNNLSFDAGSVYQQTEVTSVTKEINHEWNVEFDAQFTASFGVKVNGVGLTSGLKMGFTTSQGGSSGSSTNTTRTVSFTLADDDGLDNFSVNIKKDPAYGTPVFDLVSGQSVCPWEPGTQAREEVAISSDKTVAVNVPMNAAATFQLSLGNIAPSEDVGFYILELVPESNPHGAVVKANGVEINANELIYQVPFGSNIPVTLSVERGPVEFDYEDLRIAWRSGCEFERAIWLGIPREGVSEQFYKEIELDVFFLEPCSPIEVGFPLPGWVVTPADGNTLNVTINDYDINDPDLELVRVQWRRTNGDGAWINVAEVAKADLGPVFTIVPWDIATLQDGLYEIRAVTQCFSGALNPGISHVIGGKIERTPPEIFGTPQPADGVLSANDEISITFTEPIRCDLLIQADFFDNNNVGLYNTRTGDLVDAVITCSGDKITIVPNVANQFIENEILRVEVDNIEDLAGNTFIHTSWEFFVDRNSLRWLGGNIVEVVNEGNEVIVTRKIENVSGAAVAYDITGIPDWVEVLPAEGSLSPAASQDVVFKFAADLPLGDYLDTIQLETALGDEPLVVDFRVLCESPQWEVNPSAWAYSMNMTVQLNIEGDLSEDNMDIVAAFVNGQLRGMAYLQYVPAVDKHEAFLTVYSNDFIDGTVTFQIWDASACLLYGEVLESYPFASDELYGTPDSPITLHTNNLLLRKIALKSGWNWISFNLGFPDASLNAALASLDHPQNDLMKSQTDFANFTGAPVNGWIGSLSALGNTSMYQYRADVPDTISMLGNPIDLLTTSIPIVAGWNWIGYLPQSALPVNEALASLTALNGDVIKSQSAFAQYVAGFGWLGNLDYMQAPEGYLLKMASPGTLTYPDNFTGGGGQSLQSRNGGIVNQSPWTVDPASFEHTMIMVGMLAADGGNITAEGQTLGVFANGEVRGVAPAIYVEQLGEWMFFLTAYANGSGEPLQFKLHDAATGEISDLQEQLLFNIDGQEGTVEAPKPFTLPGALAATEATDFGNRLLIQPNPFGSSTTIRFRSAKADEAIVTMTDAVGRVVKEATPDVLAGWNQLTWEVPGLPAGVYIIKVETGGVSMASKVVVK